MTRRGGNGTALLAFKSPISTLSRGISVRFFSFLFFFIRNFSNESNPRRSNLLRSLRPK